MRNPGDIFCGMDHGLSGFVLDPAKCSQLSLEEKRELVYQIVRQSEDASKALSSFTRRELLEIICAEMGKERKYTGFTKFRMIEHLLKLVAGKSKTSMDYITNPLAFSPTKIENESKRQKKNGHPFQLPTMRDDAQCGNVREERVLRCQNLACSAILSPRDVFCRRCSCCICHCYDDNKDPTLWITCESDLPEKDESCGMSCHLKCALEHEGAGLKDSFSTKLDGSIYCVSCGKINGLMRTWRKQLLAAKVARRVDVLCLRLSLGYKILKGTELFKELLRIVETASETLEKEVGPLDKALVMMDRGIVNRLSCGADVQKLCASAVEAFDSMFSFPSSGYTMAKDTPTCKISFEELSPTTVIIVIEYEDCLLKEFLGCRLWHRKSTTKDYHQEASYIVLKPQKRFRLTDLSPSTDYFCKISLFSNTKILGTWEAKWVTPASVRSHVSILDENHGEEYSLTMKASQYELALGSHLAELQSLNGIIKSKSNESLVPSSNLKSSLVYQSAQIQSSININNNNNNKKNKSLAQLSLAKSIPVVSPTSYFPATPCKSDGRTKAPHLGGSKQLEESEYDYCVRVIRWLEHEGHMDTEFRVKFLTWFSLKATMQQRRVVSVFIDTLIDDLPSLSGQLIDTFADEICRGQRPHSHRGFCTRLWH